MISFGHRQVDRDHQFPRHRHVDHELLWDTTGHLRVRADDEAWTAGSQRGVLLPAGFEHDAFATAGTRFREAYFEVEQFGALPWPRPVTVHVTPALRELLLHLDAAPLAADVRAQLERAAFDLLQPVAGTRPAGGIPLPREERARALAELLLADPGDRRTLAELGRAVGASSRTITRMFVRDTHLSFDRWRATVRVHAAATLLEDGHTAADVARRLGYASASSFSRAFRDATGCTPGSVRRQEPVTGDEQTVAVRSRHRLTDAGWSATTP